MASTALVVGGLAVAGGLAYVLYRQAQAAKQKSACDQACTGAGDPGGHAACITACQLAGGLLGELADTLSGAYNSVDGEKLGAEIARSAGINAKLNGAIGVATPIGDPRWSGANVQLAGSNNAALGPVARYKNGCVPFDGSPGWAHCAPGTLDMFADAVTMRAGIDLGFTRSNLPAEVAFSTLAEKHAKFPGCASESIGRCTWDLEPSKPAAMMTGGKGDAATFGPYQDPVAKGAPYWYVRAQKISCASGAPRSVVAQKFGVAPGLLDGLTEACVPIDKDPTPDALISGGKVAGCTDPLYTWDAGTNLFRRLKVGETKNLIGAPCAGSGQQVGAVGVYHAVTF